MNILNRSAMLTITALLGAGCVQEPAPTVEHFRTHPDERAVQIGRCTNEKGQLQDTPVCVNAREAERLESLGRLRDLPPLGLTPQTPSPRNQKPNPEERD